MTMLEISMICLGCLIQVCVFFVGMAVGASVKQRIKEEEQRRALRKQYENALKIWHTPQRVEDN